MKGTAARAGTLVHAHARGRALRAGEAAARVKTGLAVAELDALRELLGLTMENLAGRIGISIATLSRRRQSGQHLDAGHSDRVLRFARLFRLATDLHDGDEEAARAWLRKPARLFDGETPLDHAETEAGAREVEQLIGRLEHGVYT
ncbi:MAG TPA: antitoxin Xre/MbcA/ParS toxin-binding domain-containing protein [Candidatus Kryptonia bacterium]|nr:antitoxin Xre/MbcA/ParS toxin-binding domain-containing protein [Candidatus Kryptonia bacterium]